MRKPSRRNKTCKWRAHVRSSGARGTRRVADCITSNTAVWKAPRLARTRVSRCWRVLVVWWAVPTAAARDVGVIWQKCLVQTPHLRITLLPRERAQPLDVGDHGALLIDGRKVLSLCGIALWTGIEPAAGAPGDGGHGEEDPARAPGVVQSSAGRPGSPMCMFHVLQLSARDLSSRPPHAADPDAR